jgi:AraC-like DNA-binding protein
MFIKAVCLFLGLCTSLIFIYGWLNNVDVFSAVERCLDWIWFIFSTTPFVLGYFAIYKSKIVKLSTGPISVNAALQGGEVPAVLSSEKKHDDAMDEVVMKQLKDKLENYMENYKPYINPNLSINDLAAKLKIQPHVLSRVINECYEKNFFYFINEYRIDEFKRKLEDPEYKKYKLLSIAYEVGFNSKSAFNRSFKKLTNYSPSEYFASRKLEHCELTQQASG